MDQKFDWSIVHNYIKIKGRINSPFLFPKNLKRRQMMYKRIICLLLPSLLFCQAGDGKFSLGEVSFVIKNIHLGGTYKDRNRYSELNNGIGSLDIGLLKYGFSNIDISGNLSSYNERARIKYKFSGPEFQMSNFKIDLSFEAPNVWDLLKKEIAYNRDRYDAYREPQPVINNVSLSIGKVNQYFGASGSVDLSDRNQIVEFQLDRAGYSISNVNANFIVNRTSKSTFNISDFRAEAKNVFFEFNTHDEIPAVEKAAFQVSLKNLEVVIPKDIQDDPEFKEIADYLNIHSGKFRIRQIDLDISFNRGRNLSLRGTVDTQFGKAQVNGTLFIRQPVRDDSDFTLDQLTIEIKNLSRPINDFITAWEKETGNALPRKGRAIVLEIYGDLDNPQIKGIDLRN